MRAEKGSATRRRTDDRTFVLPVPRAQLFAQPRDTLATQRVVVFVQQIAIEQLGDALRRRGELS